MSKKKSQAFTDADFVVQAQPEPNVEVEVEVTALESVASRIENGFVIEHKAIPKRINRVTGLNYPIGSLTAGSDESFFVPAESDKVKNVTSSIRTFAYRNDFTVTIRPESGGIRVWRKNDPITSVAA
jgi:hypothetical protein